MSYQLSLELNIQETDPNRILGRNKYAKHSVYQKVKSDISKLSLGKRPEKPLRSFHISATRYSPRFLDWDNLVASLKPFIDGLVLARVICDDSWEYIKHIRVDQVKSKEKRIVINVRELNDSLSG